VGLQRLGVVAGSIGYSGGRGGVTWGKRAIQASNAWPELWKVVLKLKCILGGNPAKEEQEEEAKQKCITCILCDFVQGFEPLCEGAPNLCCAAPLCNRRGESCSGFLFFFFLKKKTIF
jgi:hypothetical protein